MRRFCAIMLTVVLYLVWGTSDVALSNLSTESQQRYFAFTTHSSESVGADISGNRANSIADIAELMWHSISPSGYEMLRTSVSNFGTAIKTQQNSSHRTTQRYRSITEKIMAEAIHSRRAGHITKIFEYNPYTSSLRVVYYLHTLCRLRI